MKFIISLSIILLYFSNVYGENEILLDPNYAKSGEQVECVVIDQENFLDYKKHYIFSLIKNNFSIVADKFYFNNDTKKATILFSIPKYSPNKSWDLKIENDNTNLIIKESFIIYRENFLISFYFLVIIVGFSFGFMIVYNRLWLPNIIIGDIIYLVLCYFITIRYMIKNYPPPPVWSPYIAGIIFIISSVIGFKYMYRKIVYAKR